MNQYKNDYVPKIFKVYYFEDIKSSYIIEIQSGKHLNRIKFKNKDSIYFNPDQFEFISLILCQSVDFDITSVTYLNEEHSRDFIKRTRKIINDLSGMPLIDSLKKNDLYKSIASNYQEEYFRSINSKEIIDSLNILIDYIINSNYEVTIIGV